MTGIDYGKYLVKKPVYETGAGVKNRQSPVMTYMSSTQVPEVNYYLTVGWIYDIPEPNPHIYEHVHEHDEIMLYWGGNPDIPQVLGGEIEFYIGGQSIVVNTTTAIFIPKGIPHGPLIWNKFEFPHIEMALMLGTGNREEESKKSGINMLEKGLSKKTTKFDYEKYVVRSPMREIGNPLQKGRQNPSMTYMSSVQVNAARYYIEFGWIWGIVEGGVGQMVHDSYEEIVLHIGGDPDNPEDLGADMEFGIGGKPWHFNTSAVAFIPKGVSHGPVKWHEYRKPHIEMAIMLGAGSWREGWGDSGIGRPPEKR